MEFNWTGFAFVSEDIPNYKELSEKVDAFIEDLRCAGQAKFIRWLENQGLTMEMGVVIPNEVSKQLTVQDVCCPNTGKCVHLRHGRSSQMSQYDSCNQKGCFLSYHDPMHPEHNKNGNMKPCELYTPPAKNEEKGGDDE